MIFVPAQTPRGSIEMVTIDPTILQAALDRDAEVPEAAAQSPNA
jgi:hypothetical protein